MRPLVPMLAALLWAVPAMAQLQNPGAPGLGIAGAAVNGSGHLVITRSDGSTVDAGVVVGPAGAAGSAGATGAAGAAGTAGVSITGATINGSGRLILTLSNATTIDAGSALATLTCGTGLTCSGGTISINGVTPTAYSGALPSGALAMVQVSGTPYTATQAQMQAWAGAAPITATAATIAGAPSTAVVGTAITGVTATLTPSGATGYGSITVNGVEQTPRTAFTGTAFPALASTTTGAGTENLYAAATGGTPLASTGSITFNSSPATAATFAGTVTSGTQGTALGATGTVTPTPSGATVYVALYTGSADEGSRVATTSAVPNLTPAGSGTYYYKAYAASTGGVALATSSAITVPAAPAFTISISPYDAGPPTTGSFGGSGVNSFTAAAAGTKLWMKDSSGNAPTGTLKAVYTRFNTITPISGVNDGSGYAGTNTGGAEVTTPTVFNNSSYPGLIVLASTGLYRKGANSGVGNYYLWISPDNGVSWICFNQAMAVTN